MTLQLDRYCTSQAGDDLRNSTISLNNFLKPASAGIGMAIALKQRSECCVYDMRG
jgi:hypothetical protein